MKFTSREDKLFFLLGKFNCVSIEQIRDYCVAANKSIGLKRLDNLEKDKYIEKIVVVEKDLTENITYILGEKGIKETIDRYGNYYKSNSPIHDLKHSNYVLNTFNKDDLKYYKSEKELPGATQGASKADGAFYYPESNVILVETYTRSYTKERREAKQNYAEQLGCEMYINLA